MALIISVVIFLFLIVFGIVGAVGFLIRRGRKVLTLPGQDQWYHKLVLSKEDTISQLYLLLAVAFFGATLLNFNMKFGQLFSWQSIFFILAALYIAGAYYFRAAGMLIFGLLAMSFWLSVQLGIWAEKFDVQATVALSGLLFLSLIYYVIGRIHEKWPKSKRFALIYLIFGIIYVTTILFFLSTKIGLEGLEELTAGDVFMNSWQVSVLMLGVIIAMVAAIVYAVIKEVISAWEVFFIILLALVFGALTLVGEQNLSQYSGYSGEALTDGGLAWAIIFNVIVFFQLLGMILLGYSRKETWLINLGAVFLFLLILVKYFDWFFTFMDKSLFFISAGIVLFLVGWIMEKGRRYMLSNINTQA